MKKLAAEVFWLLQQLTEAVDIPPMTVSGNNFSSAVAALTAPEEQNGSSPDSAVSCCY